MFEFEFDSLGLALILALLGILVPFLYILFFGYKKLKNSYASTHAIILYFIRIFLVILIPFTILPTILYGIRPFHGEWDFTFEYIFYSYYNLGLIGVLLCLSPFTLNVFLKRASTFLDLGVRVFIIVSCLLVISGIVNYREEQREIKNEQIIKEMNINYELEQERLRQVMVEAKQTADCGPLAKSFFWDDCVKRTITTEDDYVSCKKQRNNADSFCAAWFAQKTKDLSVCDTELDIETRYNCVKKVGFYGGYISTEILKCESIGRSEPEYAACLVAITQDAELANQGIRFQSVVCLDFLEAASLDAEATQAFHAYCDIFQSYEDIKFFESFGNI